MLHSIRSLGLLKAALWCSRESTRGFRQAAVSAPRLPCFRVKPLLWGTISVLGASYALQSAITVHLEAPPEEDEESEGKLITCPCFVVKR